MPCPQLRLAHVAGAHRDAEGCVNSPGKHHHERNCPAETQKSKAEQARTGPETQRGHELWQKGGQGHRVPAPAPLCQQPAALGWPLALRPACQGCREGKQQWGDALRDGPCSLTHAPGHSCHLSVTLELKPYEKESMLCVLKATAIFLTA